MHYAIYGIFLWRSTGILLFRSGVPCVHFFSVSVKPSTCILLSSAGVSFAAEDAVALSTDTVLHMRSSLIVTVVGKTLITRNGPLLKDSNVLYESVLSSYALCRHQWSVEVHVLSYLNHFQCIGYFSVVVPSISTLRSSPPPVGVLPHC